jgi:L-seryl-tRNA(Ser) seleniumtransferase
MNKQPSKGRSNPHRSLPSIDALLQQMPEQVSRWGHQQVKSVLRVMLADLRAQISAGAQPTSSIDSLREELCSRLEAAEAASLIPVFNLTGTVVHTNLGRSSLPAEALAAVVATASQPSNLEFDLQTGKRGKRESHVESLICELTGAAAATVVNNNAAAVLLVLNTLALGRQVAVSRGELVEIGGSFRIPEVMQRAGCTLVEVGATNRTHLRDYEAAICAETALLMKVHTSNYRVEGFASAVAEGELAALAKQHDIPLVSDLGSGCLVDFSSLGLPAEPTAAQMLADGVDLITFSGDKLLGGPQAGIIAGNRELIDAINANPLKRALRLDKMTLAALAEVLKLYRNPDTLVQRLPTLRQLTRPLEDIQAQAQRLLPALASVLPGFEVDVAKCMSQIGSGALPVENIASAALCIRPRASADIAVLATRARQLPIPIIGRLQKGALWLDLRCLENEAAFVLQLELLTP